MPDPGIGTGWLAVRREARMVSREARRSRRWRGLPASVRQVTPGRTRAGPANDSRSPGRPAAPPDRRWRDQPRVPASRPGEWPILPSSVLQGQPVALGWRDGVSLRRSAHFRWEPPAWATRQTDSAEPGPCRRVRPWAPAAVTADWLVPTTTAAVVTSEAGWRLVRAHPRVPVPSERVPVPSERVPEPPGGPSPLPIRAAQERRRCRRCIAPARHPRVPSLDPPDRW